RGSQYRGTSIMRLNPPSIEIFLVLLTLALLALITKIGIVGVPHLSAASGVLAGDHGLHHADGRQSGARAVAAHQGIGFISRKKRPEGAPAGSVESHTAVSAPFPTVRVALGPPIAVRTQPGHMALILMLPRPSSAAVMRVSALSPAFDMR